MKKIIILLVSICSSIAVYGQGSTKIDTENSVIKWTGSKLFQFSEHYGIVKFLSGDVYWTGDRVMGGSFEIDMNSIINTDGKYSEMLVSHLKNEDFFDVKKYPLAKLRIVGVQYGDDGQLGIDALLIIKEITRPIKFKMSIEKQDQTEVFKAKFVIDRTRWGIQFKSKGIMGSVKESIISDAIKFEVVLVTKPGC